MATPNYGFEKRQKELAKKRKKEDKLKAKADRKSGLLPPEDGDGEGDTATRAQVLPALPKLYEGLACQVADVDLKDKNLRNTVNFDRLRFEH